MKNKLIFLQREEIKWKMGLAVNPFGNIPLESFDDGKNIWVGDLGGEVYYFDKKCTNKVMLEFVLKI